MVFKPFLLLLCRTAYRHFYTIDTQRTSLTIADVKMCTQGLPDVATEYVCDGSVDEICLPGDGGFVSGPDLFPLIITAFSLLLHRVFLHSWLRFGTIWSGSFCSEAERDNLVNMKQSEIVLSRVDRTPVKSLISLAINTEIRRERTIFLWRDKLLQCQHFLMQSI